MDLNLVGGDVDFGTGRNERICRDSGSLVLVNHRLRLYFRLFGGRRPDIV